MIRTRKKSTEGLCWTIGYLIQYNPPALFKLMTLERALDSVNWFPCPLPNYYYIFRVSKKGKYYVRYKMYGNQWNICLPSIKYKQKKPIPYNLTWVR